MSRIRTMFAVGAAAVMTVGGSLLLAGSTYAADHNEPAMIVNNGSALNKALDIADIYAWYTADRIRMVYTFAGPGRDTAALGTFDRDALYLLNISTDADPVTPEVVIEIRFARDAAGNWGAQLKNVPGAASTTVEMPIQKTVTSGQTTMIAGTFDDPFFFDSQGFTETKDRGDLRFCNSTNAARQVPPAGTDPRLQPTVGHCDFFFGTNDTMVIFDMPKSALDRGNVLNIWVRAARIKAGTL